MKAVLLVAIVSLVGCRRDVAACQTFCTTKMGMKDVECTEMCTRSCGELREKYDVSEKQCRTIQSAGRE